METISSVKEEFSNREKEMQRKIFSAEQRESEAYYLTQNLQKKISKEAQIVAAKETNDLQKEYDEKLEKIEKENVTDTKKLRRFLLGTMIYAIFVTMFKVVTTYRLLDDFETFGDSVIAFLINIPISVARRTTEAWQVGADFPAPSLKIFFSIIFALVVLAFYLLILGVSSWVLYKIVKFYCENFWDGISVVAAASVGTVLIWFADRLRYFPLNLVSVWVLMHLLYAGTRFIIQKRFGRHKKIG